jgi:hypothetical protein
VHKNYKKIAFSQADKIDILCEMYIVNYKDIQGYNIETKAEIIQAIYQNFIHDGNSINNEEPSEPVFDFDQDARYRIHW